MVIRKFMLQELLPFSDANTVSSSLMGELNVRQKKAENGRHALVK
jgi:hypothetical protein